MMNFALVIYLVLAAAVNAQSYDNNAGNEHCSFSEFVLVLDESATIDAHEWKSVKEFAKMLVKSAGISKDGNRAGVASFANDARIRITCDAHEDTDSFLHYIDGLTQFGTWTNIEDGLRKGKYILENKGCGQRSGAYSKIMFLLTDGTPNRGGGLKALYSMADSVKQMGIEIIAVGVGEHVDNELLATITGSSNTVFHVGNFDDLVQQTLIKKLINPICLKPLSPEKTTTTAPTTTPTTTTTTQKPTTTTTTTTTTTPTTTTPTTTTTTRKPTTTTTTPPTTTTTTTTPTTTTTTTTTTKPTTTTTTTTTPKPTTTTTVTPGKSTDICSCQVDEKSVPALKMSVYDVEKYEGTCRKEKVMAALEDIKRQVEKVNKYREDFKECKEYLRHRAIASPKSAFRGVLFRGVDECTVNIECKLAAWLNVLDKKKCNLEDELRWYQGTFGKIYDYGTTAYKKMTGAW